MILTRLTKILHTFTSENPEIVGSRIDQLLSLNSFEYLDFLIYFTKPQDDGNQKLREFTLQILRNLYFSGVCTGLKERLEKLRFTEVISHMNTENEIINKTGAGSKLQDKKKSTMMNVSALNS